MSWCLAFLLSMWLLPCLLMLALLDPAGSGKTMLMDMFYNTVKVVKKRRVHFNGFMLDVHKR